MALVWPFILSPAVTGEGLSPVPGQPGTPGSTIVAGECRCAGQMPGGAGKQEGVAGRVPSKDIRSDPEPNLSHSGEDTQGPASSLDPSRGQHSRLLRTGTQSHAPLSWVRGRRKLTPPARTRPGAGEPQERGIGGTQGQRDREPQERGQGAPQV